ncbi:MAG TPA: DUF2865 domain-containing protein [Xanthobacteraceae bacterium]
MIARTAIALGLLALTAGDGVRAQPGGLFDALFGGFMRPPPPATPVPPPAAATGAPRVSITVHPMPPRIGGPVAHCVRLCDGGHFPLPRLAAADANPEKLCNVLCPEARTRIYWGVEVDRAVAANGARYSQLKTAFGYRRTRAEGCTCNGRDVFGTAAISIYADVTLRAGDIVVAEEGFKVFVGSQSAQHQPDNFTPIQQYAGLPMRMRETLEATWAVSRRARPQPGKLDFNVRIVFGSEPLAYQVVTPEAAWPPASPLDTFPYSASACSASGC